VFAPCLLAALVSIPSTPASPSLALRPLGDVDRLTVERLADSLRTRLGLCVTVLEPRPLPRSAYYVPRARWRAEGILADLGRSTDASYGLVLGVTARDISATKGAVADWGVFGVAKKGGRAAVVSTRRLSAGGATSALFLSRLSRVAVHEVAHALGLPHCDAHGCLMNNADGRIRSVDEASGFCARCRAALTAAGVSP